MQDDPSNTYRSGASRKLLENAENADIEFSMAVLASGGPRARVGVRVYLNQRPHSRIPLFTYVWWDQPRLYWCESTPFLARPCASVWHTYVRCSHGVVTEARRVGHRLPWQPEGRSFYPPGGISRGSEPSTAARKFLVASSPPTLGGPTSLLEDG